MLKSDHFGIEIDMLIDIYTSKELLKSDHFGIEMSIIVYLIYKEMLKSDHIGINFKKKIKNMMKRIIKFHLLETFQHLKLL